MGNKPEYVLVEADARGTCEGCMYRDDDGNCRSQEQQAVLRCEQQWTVPICVEPTPENMLRAVKFRMQIREVHDEE